MGSPTPYAEAFALAVRLTGATGTRARVTLGAAGGFRVEAPLPPGMGGEAQAGVVALLRQADRFGHRYRARTQSVWAELD
ncbi:hypothetical protein OG871_30045 [Kitasatospora sp. NBC_00374]|uniref:hypothetical protein n=1 Tax=Kitasatospora sp. NBC_00374 TaxID=2975964 RepID=UPI0032551556